MRRVAFCPLPGNPARCRGVQLYGQVLVTGKAPQNQPSDAEFVERARQGVPAAFGELVARYQDRIYNTCYRMCQNHADALDLTQATFLCALEALHSFERRASFYTWIFRIAVNLTISHRRSQQRRRTISLDAFHSDGAAGRSSQSAASPTSPAEQRETHDQVAAALAQLEDEFRIAVILKDIEDLDYAAIGEILNCPLGTVKSRIHRGRMMLRELLQQQEGPRE